MNGVDWNAVRTDLRAARRGRAHAGRDAPDHLADARRAERVAHGHLGAAAGGRRRRSAGSAVDFDRARVRDHGRLRVAASSRSARPRSPASRRATYITAGRRRPIDRRRRTSTSCSITRSASASRSASRRRRRRRPRGRRQAGRSADRERAALPAVGRAAARRTSRRPAAAGSATCTCSTCRPARSSQLHLDLDAENHARDGVVIDVRNNNGGFVNVYAIDVFARRGYFNMPSRGYPDGVVAHAARPARARAADDPRHQPAFAVGRRGLHRRATAR